MELLHYIELEDMVYIATKMEWQLKRKCNTRKVQNSSSFSTWRLNFRRDGVTQTKLVIGAKIKSHKGKKEDFTDTISKFDI
jgi:hypothetical protein